jgi:hypothetical protein
VMLPRVGFSFFVYFSRRTASVGGKFENRGFSILQHVHKIIDVAVL